MPTVAQINDPLMDQGMQGWIVNQARENYWRVARWYDLSDLVQDGYVAFAKCKKAYGHLFATPPTEEERKWFMCLVKTTYLNHIYDLAMSHTRCLEATEAWLAESDEKQMISAWASDIAAASVVISQMPSELKALVASLAEHGNDYRKSRLRKQKTANGATRVVKGRKALRETTNQLYCRLAGLDADEVDLSKQIAEHFA